MDIDDIRLIRPESKDVVIARFSINENVQKLREISKTLEGLFPNNNVIMLPENIDISTMSEDDLRQQGLQVIK